MKNPYILTLTLLFTLTCSLRVVSAWPQAEDAPDKSTAESTQPTETKSVPTQNEEALQVVRDSRTRLFDFQSVQADMTQRVALGDFHFQASGKYFAVEGFKSRIEYSVKLGEMEGDFLEVCDGQILHTRRQIRTKPSATKTPTPPQVELTRRDIQKIIREIQLYADKPEAYRAAEMGIGGLPAVLASLERTMIFDAIREEEEEGEPVLVVQGVWNPNEQNRILTGLGGLSSQIQEFLPDRVRISFSKATLFPRKFQYLKKLTEEETSYRPILTVSFTNVILNEPIPAQRFSYIPPPGMEERDETAIFIEAIQKSAKVPTPDSATKAKNE